MMWMTKQEEIAIATAEVEECKAKLESYKANGASDVKIEHTEVELEWREKALEMVDARGYCGACELARRKVFARRRRQAQLKHLWKKHVLMANVPNDQRWIVLGNFADRDNERKLAKLAKERLHELQERIANPAPGLHADKVEDLKSLIRTMKCVIRVHKQRAEDYDQSAKHGMGDSRE
jgi:hypothetical protein